ncbi:DMT family transporter [Polymorphum gilvum]|uniref:Integral membrane protein DUF6 n=1 Tax=Polymorphum gilvum (strain LMG 25793 / CGMCC 1.9160 / SL003B-26A1) TaxID=991905 RepID=F2IWD4_POLGS|nr:DMT family transporter [Polymorphum gilvum]ADZ69233.1 Integral membrane protein DUF6 [Polymorphum gilvum SL003B-26A1]
MNNRDEVAAPAVDAGDAARAAVPAETPRTPVMGIVLIVLACLCFSCLDATAKYLVVDLPPLQVVWVRFLTHLVFAVVVFRVWRAPEIFRTDRPGLQFVRGLALLGSTFFNFLAVQYLQLAETMSIMFAGPFVVTALAGPLLGEWAGLRRWIAIIVGFIGVLIIARPGLGGMHWAAIYSIGAMICYAFYALFTRMLAGSNSTIGMLIISAAVPTVAMTPAGLSLWETPASGFHWLLLLSTGLYGGFGHWIFIIAHRLAPAPLLAPFTYLQIVWMVGLGFLVFGDVPGPWTLVGSAVVIASGLYILYRERIVKRH